MMPSPRKPSFAIRHDGTNAGFAVASLFVPRNRFSEDSRKMDIQSGEVNPSPALSAIASKIDWDISPNQLLAGNLSILDPQDAWLIERAAASPEVVAVAKQLNINPIALIVALIARLQSLKNRSAARIAKAIFGDGFTEALRDIAKKLDLG